MTREDLRAQAAISVLNSLLETTKHSVVEYITLKDIYADVAVLYADALVNSLDKISIDENKLLEKFKHGWNNYWKYSRLHTHCYSILGTSRLLRRIS